MKNIIKFEAFLGGSDESFLGSSETEEDKLSKEFSEITDKSKKRNELTKRAGKIIGKYIPTVYGIAIRKITDFIEENIENESLESEIDELTEIKRELKTMMEK